MVDRSVGAALALVLLVVLAATGASGAIVPTAPSAQETPKPPAVDNTLTRIELAPDGSARWRVTIRTRLPTPAAVDEFEAFQARFRENTSRFLDPFESRIRSVVAGAAAATGREMTAANFTAQTHVQEVPRRWGIVTYAFTWSGFAATSEGALVVGDAFDGGFFLATNDTLTVVVPAGYAISRVAPAPADRGERAVTWTGRVDFPDGRPLVRAAPAGAAGGGPAGPHGGTPLSGTTLLGGGAALLVLLVGLATVAYRRRSGAAAGATAGIPPTDEERVLDLLESHEGRLPQAAVVEAFDWSTSKTSRVLGQMAEAGAIEKLQLGRENLIRLPDDDE